MAKIIVEGIKLYAYHGCLPEEAVIGCDYQVDVVIETDFSKAAVTDDLNDAIDYVVIYEITRKQMQLRSKLIEHVGKRIYDDIKGKYGAAITKLEVIVTKINPPMNGNVEKVSVVVDK